MLRVYLYASVPTLLLSVFLCISPALAQFDTEYWMPPVWESRDSGPQRGPGNPGYGGLTRPTELVVTTAYVNVTVQLIQANGTPEGELLATKTVQAGVPAFFNLSELSETTPPKG